MSKCLECGVEVDTGKECRDYLNELIKWDFEDFMGAGQVHHLTVLCYNLQHPSVYSKKGLEDAKDFLKEFVMKNVSFKEHDDRNRARLGSDVRDWKISGTAENHGEYIVKPVWIMTAREVFEDGKEQYIENVKNWSQSVYESLEQSGNLG